jgi:flagellar export protein FliJ
MTTSFRLARVLRLRRQLRRLRHHEAETLAAGLATLEEEGRQLATLRMQLGEEEAVATAAGALTPALLQLRRRYDHALAAREGAAAALAREQRGALDAKREELLDARREERKLLRLEAVHRQRVAEAEERRIDRLLDELALQAHGRLHKGENDGRE